MVKESLDSGFRMAADGLQAMRQSFQIGQASASPPECSLNQSMQSRNHCIEAHGQSLANMGQTHELGLVAHGQGIETAGRSPGQGIESFGQSFTHGVEAHAQGIETAGNSLNQGMTSAGQELNLGMTALGCGFADMGKHISKSIALLSFASIVRCVVELGYVYVVVMSGMAIVIALLLWNLQMHARLAHHHWRQSQEQRGNKRIGDEVTYSRKLEADLASMKNSFSKVEAELASSRCKEQKTEHELEESRILLLKMSNELTQTRGMLQRTSKELEEARSDPFRLPCFEPRNDPKRRRSA